jgi:hypothetical protein
VEEIDGGKPMYVDYKNKRYAGIKKIFWKIGHFQYEKNLKPTAH